MATIGGAEGQNLNCKIVCTLIFITALSLQDKIGNFKVAIGIFVGKEFDALLIDVAAVAGAGQLPVFDVFPSDSFQV